MKKIFEPGKAYIRRNKGCSGILTLTKEISPLTILAETFPLWDPHLGISYSATGRYLGDDGEDSEFDLVEEYIFPNELKVAENNPLWG